MARRTLYDDKVDPLTECEVCRWWGDKMWWDTESGNGGLDAVAWMSMARQGKTGSGHCMQMGVVRACWMQDRGIHLIVVEMGEVVQDCAFAVS